MKLFERFISREKIFDGNILHVVRDTVELENGDVVTREVIHHGGAVCVIPVTGDGKVIIERQYRYAVEKVMLEIPAGKLEPGEDPEVCAARELEEETGYTADKLVYMGEFYASPAILNEKVTMYLALGLKKGKKHLDADEFLEVSEMPLEELLKMCVSGEISDSKTQLALFKYMYMKESGMI
ncbi:MAG: NUDIX hydrolase [Clostridia bacterium]|nr:NUDIX hydrolase [Clostridia bacterium]